MENRESSGEFQMTALPHPSVGSKRGFFSGLHSVNLLMQLEVKKKKKNLGKFISPSLPIP